MFVTEINFFSRLGWDVIVRHLWSECSVERSVASIYLNWLRSCGSGSVHLTCPCRIAVISNPLTVVLHLNSSIASVILFKISWSILIFVASLIFLAFCLIIILPEGSSITRAHFVEWAVFIDSWVVIRKICSDAVDKFRWSSWFLYWTAWVYGLFHHNIHTSQLLQTKFFNVWKTLTPVALDQHPVPDIAGWPVKENSSLC